MEAVKVGLLARSEDRGLGLQSWEFFRHMHPDRTLHVDMGELARGFPSHPERFPGATNVRFEGGQFDRTTIRNWLDGLDVVVSCETFYDWRMVDWARDMGVATVCQVNPEFYKHDIERASHPTAWWAPSPWLIDRLPDTTRLVPVPVAAERFPMTIPERTDRLRVLHIAGHRAANDRNGTLQLLTALRAVSEPMLVRLLSQDSRLPRNRPRHGVEVVNEAGGRENYWDLYDDADVLVLPRRYGGLCLPVQEAMASGLAVVMTDCPPNDWWPTIRTRAPIRGTMNTGLGKLPMHAAEPRDLARMLSRLAAEPEFVTDYQARSLGWAETHSWDALRPLYETELARAC